MRGILYSSSCQSSSNEDRYFKSDSQQSIQDIAQEGYFKRPNLSESSSESNLHDLEIRKCYNSQINEKLWNPTKRIQKKQNKDAQNKQNQYQIKKIQNQLMVAKNHANLLFNSGLPNTIKELFITNDVYIEFDKNIPNDIGFERYRALQNELRPISKIKYLKDSSFLVLEFDEQKRGTQNFDHIVEYLKSMQDQNLYFLAQCLSTYGQIMSFSKQLENNIPVHELKLMQMRNKTQFQQYLDNDLPQILNKLDKSKFYVYYVYDMTEGFHNQIRKQYGMNEKFIQLFGSSVEEITNLQMRQGWFNFTQFNDRNRQGIEYFLNTKAVYESSFNFNAVDIGFEYEMVTIENIKVLVNCSPTYNFCFSKTDFNPIFHNQPLLIGFTYLLEINLQPNSKKMIRDIRMKSQTKQFDPKQNQQKFSYEKYDQIEKNIYSKDLSDERNSYYHSNVEKFKKVFIDGIEKEADKAKNQETERDKICQFVVIQKK
ncbi:hypothetical protein TTHERM_00666500 (macronuclear) [Tetrahymena thermophila SB210]|uniref:Uncharacterized protein n=1 Tax=Tetrahymena thermophila (strain SB210) TaxID=312017 RepID=Q23TD2_TETTS|nr:hypothetical protein TTHERM_00666500 [Tetrahymena thermophila SB210]EAR99774.1 hypothetical protein TTHERM_00666500 [Tetrahymena thermophila SB210]|eukprot:XP_001020019.1 hypothetical protein TTHERM_00666500 [Tetrahymena thermophila SB210]